MKPTQTKHQMIKLRAQGYSFDNISEKLETSKKQLIEWSRELEEEIAQMKATELESLYEQFYLLKESRIKKLGGVLQKIENELERRDLSDIPTDKLLEYYGRYYSLIKDEMIDPVFLTDEDIAEKKEERNILNSH